jgi:uncharacterized protein (TIGR02147 family)
MQKAKKDVFSAALEAKDYRSFLKLAMERRYAHREMTLAELATRSGFSSKGFISDLLAGRKKITAKALPKIMEGLNLPKRLAGYFELLVQLEEEGLRPQGLKEAEIRLQLGRLKRVFRDRQAPVAANVKAGIYRHVVYKVYAALGSAEKGASWEELLKRSRLPESAVKEALDLLLGLALVREEGRRFYAEMGNIEAFGLNETSRFQEVMASATAALAQKIQKVQPADLFFYASFALDAEKEALLKQKLQELLSSFVDQNQNEDGDLVKTLVLGFI